MELGDGAITLAPIGVVRSPWQSSRGAPIQPSGARGVRATVEVRQELGAGLSDLEGFSHVFLLYLCDRAIRYSLTPTPFLDSTPRGVFATRAPARPNPIGLSVVRLVSVRGAVLEVEDLDALDGTPVLDIKPFVPEFDVPTTEVKVGWLSDRIGVEGQRRGDDRFER